MARSLCLHSIFSCIVDVLAWKPNHTTAESSSKSWDRLPLSSLFLASSLFLKRRSICDWSAVLSQPLFCTGYNCVAALNSFGIQVQFCAEQCKKKTPHSKFANEGYLWADFIKVQFSGAVQLLFLWHFRDLIKEEISSINIFILWVNWTHRKAAALFSSIYFMRKHSPSFSGHHGTSSCCEICLSEEPATVPRVSLTWLWLYIFPPPSHAIFLNFSDNSRPESPTEPPQSLLQRARFKLDPSSWRIVTSETGVLECETINQISMDTGHLRH